MNESYGTVRRRESFVMTEPARLGHEAGQTPLAICLSFPADARFVNLARLSAVSLAVEAGFSIDEIEEFKMGVNEVVGLLVELNTSTTVDSIELTFRIAEDAIEMHGVARGDRHDPLVLDELARHILDAVTDGYEVGPGSGRIVKRRTS